MPTRSPHPTPAPRFFASPERLRAWFERHHESASELWVGFHRRGTGKPSITWPQSVDEALCFGWIDGVRKTIDAQSYTIRFTPRKADSVWSAINIARVATLTEEGRMQPAGLRAFERRSEKKSGIYSYENRKTAVLPPADERRFKAETAAWTFFASRPPWYRKTAIWWVISAKRPETRERRLQTLIADSAAQRFIGPLRRAQPKPVTPPTRRE